MTPSTSRRPRGHIPLQQRPGSYSPVAQGRCSCGAPAVSAAMQTTLSYRLELSVPMGRGARRGRGLRELSGAPGRPKEGGCPVWKTGCPRGTRGCTLPTHLLTQTSPSCPAGPLPPGWLSQPEQEGDRWGQVGTGWAQASAGAFLFHSCTVSSALCSRYVPRRAGSSTGKRGAKGGTGTHTEPSAEGPKSTCPLGSWPCTEAGKHRTS